MKHFIVEVHTKGIEVHQQNSPLSTVHVRAIVDGEPFVYQIKKRKYAELGRGWFGRGSNHAYYHARNAGNYVRFEQVKKESRSSKKNSPKQMSLF